MEEVVLHRVQFRAASRKVRCSAQSCLLYTQLAFLPSSRATVCDLICTPTTCKSTGLTKPPMVAQLQSELSSCTNDVGSWMAADRLQLITTKTEVLWYSTGRRQHLLPTSATEVGTDLVASSSSVRDLDIYLDADASKRTNVTRTVPSCFIWWRDWSYDD